MLEELLYLSDLGGLRTPPDAFVMRALKHMCKTSHKNEVRDMVCSQQKTT